MSITDELREWASANLSYKSRYDTLIAIADRIDAGYKREVVKGLNEWKHGRDEAWDEAMEMLEREYVRLPVDADGVPIHVGERVQLIGNDPSTVSHMSLADDGWRVYVKYDGGIGTGSGEPKRIRHYHAPTVEDVLTEFAAKLIERGELTNGGAQTIAEYAAKLRLAEEEDA